MKNKLSFNFNKPFNEYWVFLTIKENCKRKLCFYSEFQAS